MSTVLYEKTKRGQKIISSAERNIGYELSDIYRNWSWAKQTAYNDCYDKYLNTDHHYGFHICSKNTNSFTVAWYGYFGGQEATFYETKDYSYVVLHGDKY